ncbi:hypothetical protein BIY24_11940 [Halobacteriovorax marinus]|uniref:hypothetical protein n=1 Tax=Halobacteriovorax marinus TaxID=97084 RepID=UPI000BC302AD|nr:hypothetical protein [Halobacteriovorax marinus]ATH08630.1 hypothetical protein BIY24_11940 [Halobacteriovorax marinus]
MKALIALLTLFILLNPITSAQTTLPPTDDELEGELKYLRSGKTKDQKSLDEELRIQNYDLEAGLSLDSYSTSKDSSRVSLLYNLNTNPMKAMDVSGFEFQYARKLDRAWWEFYGAQSSAKFSQVADANGQFPTFSSDEISEQTLKTTTLGSGLSYRTSLIQTLFSSDNLFETIGAFVNYNKTSTELGESYSGPGMKADFGLHYRTSNSFHWGMRFNYNLAHVKRSKVTDTEKSSERSLLLKWTSFAADLSFYF